MLKKILLISFILSTNYYLLTTNVHAASEFSTSYDFSYDVLGSGVTNVTQKISLTNLTTAAYPIRYSLILNAEKISSVSAWQNLKPLKINVTHGLQKTQIEVFFEEKIVGIRKTIDFILNYQSTEIASQKGKIWEVVIPKASPYEVFEKYNVKLAVPVSFGSASYLRPVPKINYQWEGKNASNGITAVFGSFQSLEFSFVYALKNSSLLPKIIKLNLPVNNSSQEIHFLSLNPKPLKDNRYFLWPFQTLKIKVNGYAKIFKYPFKIIGLPKESQIIYGPTP